MALMQENLTQSNAVEQHSSIQSIWTSEPILVQNEGASEISMATFLTADGGSGSPDAVPDNEEPTGRTEFSLPPVDKGMNAILILVCGFLVEACTYGLPLSYSIFQNYYSTQPEFRDSGITSLVTVGALWSGLTLMGAGLVAALSARFSLKTLMYIGSFIMAAGLIGASFATNVWHLILTQGVVLGIGSSFVSNAFMPFVPMWWFKYRGIATGIIFSGAGLMGLVTPIAIERSLAAVGFRWTLRILSLFTLVLCLSSSYAVRTRYLPDASGTMRVSFTGKDFRFLTSRKFVILGACVLFQGLGYFIPNLFIQPYALSVGVPVQTSTTLVSVMNAMTVVGQLMLGHVCDRFGYWKALVISSTAASLSTFIFWRMAGSSLTTIFVYVVIYAGFGAGFTTCFPAMVADIADDPNQFVLISGAFMMLRGTGNIVGNPLGSIFLTTSSSIQAGWNEITYFVGGFLLLSAAFGGIRGVMTIQSRV
ncbi:major facilitator superfamily domain-containing protein [Umbelopsis sp. AD052]|nr:major facilitator superfamily domain-containing protein [Umbelopsis sp. AD052]